jgi:hypothetical protein
MTKEELIARLKELGSMLNREISLTGSKEELALRIAELEEELGDDIDDGGDSNETGPEIRHPEVRRRMAMRRVKH